MAPSRFAQPVVPGPYVITYSNNRGNVGSLDISNASATLSGSSVATTNDGSTLTAAQVQTY